ncbi:MAG: TonB-dependent receptor, partial [Caulobacteraceae bacterium]
STFRIGYSGIEDDQYEREDELDVEDEVVEGEITDSYIEDTEFSASFAHEFELANDTKLEFGVQYWNKNRDTTISSAEGEVEGVSSFRILTASEFEDFEAIAGGISTIEETRIDPYVMLSGETGPAKWQVGLRYETTSTDITDETVDDDLRNTSNDYDILLPSASVRFALSDADRITASVARTVRRPDFNFISPAVLEGEYGDNDFLGNPDLNPETAWGGDLGFEHRIGRRGVIGVNVFYRKVTDLIELVNTGEYSDEAEGNYEDAIEDGATPEEAAEELTSFVLTAENVGDGEVYGVELDLSTPLDFLGMENTGVYLNASWLDSNVDDFMGERRFNSQSNYVYNVGFTQDLPTWGMAFGASYRKQGDADSRIIGEEVTTSYGADLEVFVEKTFANNIVVRLTGSNLLDSSKDESFDKFNTIEDQLDRDYDEYELETEKAGPVFQLVARVAF